MRTITLILVFVCLLIYLIQPYFKISFFSKQDETSNYSFFLYGYEKKDDSHEYICQYKCREHIKNIDELKNKDNCTIYYLDTKASNLDDTSLDMIKNPLNFRGTPTHKKSFNLKNIKTLVELNTIEQKPDEKFCEYVPYKTLDKDPIKFFIKIYDNDYYNQDLHLNIQDSSNDVWDRYLVSMPSKKIKDATMYHYKEIKDRFILIGSVSFETDFIDKVYDLVSSRYNVSSDLNKLQVNTMNNLCFNNYNTLDILKVEDIKDEKIIKKIHLHNNLEYLGLSLENTITDPSNESGTYGLAYGGLIANGFIAFENQKILCLKNIVPIKEDDNLRFIEEYDYSPEEDSGIEKEDNNTKKEDDNTKEKSNDTDDITLLTFWVNPTLN